MREPFEATLQPGTLLAAEYEIVRVFDSGSKHEIYDVWSRHRRCRCIAKTMSGDPPYQSSARQSLLREGRLLARFTHPHIVRSYETIHEPRPVVILETLTGETLSYAIDRLERLRVVDIALLGQQLCSATAYLHQHGWLHLDLKPSNIVCESGMAKVLDLSVTRRPGRARPGVGTHGYMSPEQIDGRPLSTAADVWGIGIVMFEAATGLLPFEDPDDDDSEPEGDETSSSTDLPSEPITEPPPSLATRRRVPRALTEVVDRCLALDPGDRPSLEDLSQALEGVSGIDPKRAGTAKF